MPGVHFAWPVAVPHVPPMLGVAGEQSAPLQQRAGFGAVCGVQVSPPAQAPVESQRQPRWPATHVAVTLGGATVPLGIVQSEPLQQVSGVGADWGVHLRPGWQIPGLDDAQGQPCRPRMQPGGRGTLLVPPLPLAPDAAPTDPASGVPNDIPPAPVLVRPPELALAPAVEPLAPVTPPPPKRPLSVPFPLEGEHASAPRPAVAAATRPASRSIARNAVHRSRE